MTAHKQQTMSTQGAKAALRAALGDVSRGFFDITHNGLALLGTLLAVGLITLAARSDLRTSAEQQLLGWLLERQQMTAEALDVAAFNPEPSAIERVTAAQPTDLPKQQANVAFWLSRKYRVAPEPLSVLVAEAFDVGQKARVDPTLILAVMAIESRFNPFAQSPVGAQGLMQVLTRVHTDKYEDFGGRLAAFDPVSNLRVGAKVLQPKLDTLLPLVALGTVADVVRLDANNRRLVAQGLKRVRSGAMPAGLASLFVASGRVAAVATTFDFGFALGPRINAAGRLSDMTLGIECLTTDDPARADELAKTLDGINRERRVIEGDMREQAMNIVEGLFDEGDEPPPAICVFDPDFHEGVVGIVASRIKDKLHRPSFVFAASSAPGKEHELKGSGRSIPGFHLRDALDLVAKRYPGVLLRFGGHAMAAGCTIAEEHFDDFEQGLNEVAQEWLDAATLTRRLETDGPLAPEYRRVDLVDTLHKEVWGQGFAAPTFSEEVEVVSQRLVGEKHLALKLKHQGQPVDGIWFGHTDPLPARVTLAFRLDADEWNGVRRVRFLVEGAEV